MQLLIDINVLDEARLRSIAAERMASSGFEDDPAVHIGKPLHELIFEALIGSNPDTVAPVDMGVEIVSWTEALR